MGGVSGAMDDGAGGGQAKIVAVLSAASGTGCTSTVANLAFWLAVAGRRVLVIDWGSDVPHAREYLEPFHVGQQSLPDGIARSLLAAYTASAVRDDQLPMAARYTVPGAVGLIDVFIPVDQDGAARARPSLGQGGVGAIVDLQSRLPRAGYDDVLIDAPTGSVDASLKLIAELCDLALVCFRPRPKAIRDAAEVATRLRRDAPTGIGVLPVATLFDDTDQPRAQRMRTEIRTAFADVLAAQELGFDAAAGTVEIPSRSYDTFDPLLTVLVEEPDPGNTLLAGYSRLAAAVTAGAVTTPPALPPAFRSRYQRVFGLQSLVEPDRILIAYATEDRPWADWVRDGLQRAGAETRTLRGGMEWLDQNRPLGLVIISSTHMDESPEHAAVTEIIARAEAAGRPLNVLRVQIDAPITPVTGETVIAVTASSEPEQIAQRLLTHFGLINRPGVEPARGLRLPGTQPEIFSVPPRHPRFVGRDQEIERLRDLLTEPTSGGGTMVTVSGVPGIGKSELVLEYAYRFASTYDLVWWVPAGDVQSATVSLASIGTKLEPAPQGIGTAAVLDRLADDPAHSRFLLIYDNVEDRAQLDDLLPTRHRGHVVITSSEPPRAEFELAAMTPRDGTLLLTSRVPSLSEQDAQRVADAAGHLPIALELAGSWLVETAAAEREDGATVVDAATLAVNSFIDKLEGLPADGGSGQHAVSRVVAVVAESLREKTAVGRLAVRIAQMCSFLAQDGISLDLVRSTAMIDRLVAMGDCDALRLDAMEIDRALWAGVRHGLFRVDWSRNSALRVHRVVQAALRDAMTEQERAGYSAAVLSTLAAFAPTEVEAFAQHSNARFAELQKHLVASGALESHDDAVRRWLVNQVYFLFSQGTPEVRRTALEPAQRLLDGWTARHGPADLLRLRLASQLANLYRVLGDHPQALRLDDSALAGQRRSLELNHPQVLRSARGRGGDLRGLGLFADALEEDQATWEGLREAFGEDHPQTRMAAHNLASAMFLSGDVPGALRMAEANYRQGMRLLGEDEISTWSPLIQIGIYQRELGNYTAARNALVETAQHLRRLRPEPNQAAVIVQWYQAITLRCRGSATAAKERNGQVLRDLRELLGPDHPNTLACMLSFAAANRAVGGEPALSVELAEMVLDGYLHKVRYIKEHPFVALTRIGLGLAQNAAGQDGSAQTGQGLELLRVKLGTEHPWTIAATIDHSRVIAVRGATKQAAELITAAHAACLEFFGELHPYTTIAAHNLRLTLDHAGGTDNEPWREIDVDIPES